MKGTAHKYAQNNIDTDVIIPGPYLKIMDPDELAKHAMEGLDKEFVNKVKQGDFIVSGENFGCGSSREHAPIALKHAGITAVLALSFARIFYRNSVDGAHLLPIEIEEDAYENISDKDQLEIDIQQGEVRNITKNKTYKMKPFSELIRKIIDAGGILNYTP
ncbi:MAG: 3-isopropylmalate/(R)-2-methylmalate dehydratase small subunit [Candidatus Nitrosomirales archaeon]|jgi:3-isopropylmalate/(R)-2-methylmalate dehydratase small subunit